MSKKSRKKKNTKKDFLVKKQEVTKIAVFSPSSNSKWEMIGVVVGIVLKLRRY